MKHFWVYRFTLNDSERIKLLIRLFVIQERIPMPISVQLTDEFEDYFMQNKVAVFVYSMALTKTNKQ